MLARELGYLTTAQFNELRQSVDEVQRMLASLIRKLLAGS